MPGLRGADLRLWARSELRRRWLSLVLLGVLGGLAGGLAIAAYDGAQRSETAYDRMRDQLHGADVILFPSQVAMYDFDPTILDSLPEVESWGGFSLNDSSIDGLPAGATPMIVSNDWFATLEGAKLLQGRLPDPTRDDEALVTAPILDQAPDGFGVGSELTWRNLTFDEAAQFGDEGAPPDFDWTTAQGTVTTLTIVGVVRMPLESVAAFASEGLLLTSPGWAAQHVDDTPLWWTNAIVRLRHGAADVPALKADIARLTGRADIPVKELSTDIKRVQRSLDVEHTALLMFAGALAIAALVLVGQAIVRATASGATAAPPLRAMGATTVGLVVGLTLPMLVTVITTLVVAAIVAIVASRWFPVGLSRRVDPDLGVHVVASRVVLGALIATGLVLAVVAASAAVLQRERRTRSSRRAHLLGALTRAGVPLSPAIGASLAVDSSGDRGGRSRLALLAGAAGVVAVVGALTLVRGIDDIVEHPERTGATWDLELQDTGAQTEDDVVATLLADADIADIARVGRVASAINGLDAPIYALDVIKGSMSFTVVRGRAPTDDGEIALGPATMRALDVDVGDTVVAGPQRTPVRVVGVALLAQHIHSSFDEGGWVTRSTYAPIAANEERTDQDDEGFLGLAEGVTAEAAISRLPPFWYITQPSVSTDATNLAQVRGLPIYLAVFLALLAVGAVAHALFTGARQRARELAVLRALGLTARQVAACVSWQALAIGAVAVVAGIPVGVIVGRRVWRAITEQLSFVYVGPWSSNVLAAAVPVCLLGCVLLAILPARSTAQRGIADTLRDE